MYAVRRFAVRHARFFDALYQGFERVIVALDPLLRRIGYQRLERPVAAVERLAKGLVFDCQMCGQCVLSSTGMSCPMNCPKTLRNGPCGGVRPGGYCEVKPSMRCVWVEAWEGAERMPGGIERILVVQPPVDRTLEGSSSWLRVAREKAAIRRAAPSDAADPGKVVIARAFGRARRHDPASAPLAAEPDAALSDQAMMTQRTAVYPAPAPTEKSARDRK
ncbi:MAG TPA: methylenetetrahydrofolate reductase C-terminal domain-containing protein [Aestuariivirgaceae bacterium]|nr:methylenetetrahydrofolate reductase C-terminal domain-containing protein [Aestuariivirgaceae bacterium]